MGVVRYLCITILLVFLSSVYAEVFDAPTTPALACTKGRPLNGACLCESGFGGALCDSDVLSACGSPATAVVRDSNNYPKLAIGADHKISFTANTLTASILGDHVTSRTYTDVTFIGASKSFCSLNGAESVWKISADASGVCKDNIALTLKWSDHAACGFKLSDKNAVSTHYQFRSTIVLSYTDKVGLIYEKADEVLDENKEIAALRKTQVSYDLYVRFQKSVTVKVDEVVIESKVNQRVAVTAVLFDAVTSKVQIDVDVITDWPNRLIDDNEFDVEVTAPEGVIAERLAVSTDVQCGNTDFSFCRQRLTFHIDTKDNCTFDGPYLLEATVVTCRVETDRCTKSDALVSFEVHGSDVCGAVSDSPIVEGKLIAYTDAAHTDVSTNFLLGETGYFATLITSVNSIKMNYIDIWVQEVNEDGSVQPERIYFLDNHEIVTDYSTADIQVKNAFGDEGPVKLVVDDISRNGEDTVDSNVNVFTPHFKFLFHSSVFSVAPEDTKVYNVYATGNITYLGNERYNAKREEKLVDFVWRVDSASMSSVANVGIASQSVAKAAITPAQTSSSVVATVLPIAGVALVAIVGAVVIAVVIVKRKKQTQGFNILSN